MQKLRRTGYENMRKKGREGIYSHAPSSVARHMRDINLRLLHLDRSAAIFLVPHTPVSGVLRTSLSPARSTNDCRHSYAGVVDSKLPVHSVFMGL